jgi:hypothetical protein
MSIAHSPAESSQTLGGYEEKIAAQVRDAHAKLEQFEASAKKKGLVAGLTAAAALHIAKRHIDQKLKDLKATHATHRARAQADINTEVAAFTAAVAALIAKNKSKSE